MEVRSKKLERRNAAHALMNARMCEQSFGRTNMHADRQTDGRTPSRTRACKHTNSCIDERRLVRSNIWTHEHARGQTGRQTDGRTDSHIRNHARAHAHTHERWHAYKHTRCTQVDTHGRRAIGTHVRTEANTQEQTWKLEVRS